MAEAEFYVSRGFDDICYAVPLDPTKIQRACAIYQTIPNFHVMVDNMQQLDALLAHGCPAPDIPWSVVLMCDCGYGRDGVDVSSDEAVALAQKMHESSDIVTLYMLYTHGGHSYDVPYGGDVGAIVKVSEQERDVIKSFADKLKGLHLASEYLLTGIGSTPTCSHPPSHLDGISEMHPGNYFTYDYNQLLIGSCRKEDIACKVATRIVGHYPHTNQLQIDCGWTGTSAQGKEYNYGCLEGEDNLKITNLKQEAGTVTTLDGSPIDFTKYPVGKMMFILPWHSCASIHQHRVINVVAGDQVVDIWDCCDGW
jgi:D-serine deaminase-like pyridoxal phosphate-dependent protein